MIVWGDSVGAEKTNRGVASLRRDPRECREARTSVGVPYRSGRFPPLVGRPQGALEECLCVVALQTPGAPGAPCLLAVERSRDEVFQSGALD